jgi:hypothetical protein
MHSEVDRRAKEGQLRAIQRACVFVIEDTGNDGAERFCIGSGFVVQVRRWWWLRTKWVWVTAAHVLDEFDEKSKRGPVKVMLRCPTDPRGPVELGYEDCKRVSLRKVGEDLLGTHGPVGEPRPRILRLLRTADIGCVELPHQVQHQLKHRGALALNRKSVRIYSQEEVRRTAALQMFTFGVPGNSKMPEPSWDNPTVTFKQLEVTLAQQQDLEDRFRILLKPLWRAEEHVGSIAGMSGGPVGVVGFRVPVVVSVVSVELASVESTADVGEDLAPHTLMTIEFGFLYDLIWRLFSTR